VLGGGCSTLKPSLEIDDPGEVVDTLGGWLEEVASQDPGPALLGTVQEWITRQLPGDIRLATSPEAADRDCANGRLRRMYQQEDHAK